MAITASYIPQASGPDDVLVDIGGTAVWLPIYAHQLGYRQLVLIGRPQHSFYEALGRECVTAAIGDNVSLTIIDADAEWDHFPLGDGSISCALCFEVLEHLAGDPGHLFEQVNRILRPAGRFLLTTPNVLWAHNLLRFAFGGHPFSWSVYTGSYADRHNREFTPYELQGLFEATGFHVESLMTFDNSRVFERLQRIMARGFCIPAALSGRVDLGLRRQYLMARGRKVGPVRDRYPSFLYEMYGADHVSGVFR